MKIRIIKDLPRCEIGQEFEVDNHDGLSKIFAETLVADKVSLIYYLDEIKGYYEEAEEMPAEGEIFWFIDSEGIIDWLRFDINNLHHKRVIKYQRHNKTKESAETFRDEILKIREKEDEIHS